jgi:hypothetical protein
VYFFTYFVVEHLMQRGNHHLGVSDDEAIERFIDLLSHGLWKSPGAVAANRNRIRVNKVHVNGSALHSLPRKSLRQIV